MKTVRTPEHAYEVFLGRWDMSTIRLIEQMKVMQLISSIQVLWIITISTGKTSTTPINPKLVFATALKCCASKIILAHNHPSGNCVPSASDIAITERIDDGAKLLDITLEDHLIISPDGYFF